VVRLKGNGPTSASTPLTLQWISPSGDELWNSGGQIEITPPPATVTEMDFRSLPQWTCLSMPPRPVMRISSITNNAPTSVAGARRRGADDTGEWNGELGREL
jgi:hypothetical protein